MCMKYINATISCYKSLTITNNEISSFNGPFNSIKSEYIEKGLVVKDFFIVTQINFLGTNNEEHKNENPMEQNATIDFIIRLTKCSQEPKNRLGCDLAEFSINLQEMRDKKQVSTACFDFLNYTRITNVDKLDLPYGNGKYVIKILAKDSNAADYTIQSISQLDIL